MPKRLITGDGRIFEEQGFGHGQFKEIGGKGVTVSTQDLKDYERYSGVKIKTMSQSKLENPQFTKLMEERALATKKR